MESHTQFAFVFGWLDSQKDIYKHKNTILCMEVCLDIAQKIYFGTGGTCITSTFLISCHSGNFKFFFYRQSVINLTGKHFAIDCQVNGQCLF